MQGFGSQRDSGAIQRLPSWFLGAVVLLALQTSAAMAAEFDESAVWPLCGRISEAPPAGWDSTQGCPSQRHGDPAYSDYPLSSAFGPRQKASQNFRYDYHRGIDIPTAAGTPVFAVTDGEVKIAGNHSAYSDPLVQLAHVRPGANGCKSGGGCYYSNYMHLSDWVVAPGDEVSRGQLLGYTGASESGFEHLHFEIRNANAADIYSRWQRDAIHPLHVLPYDQGAPTSLTANIIDVQPVDAETLTVTVRVEQATVEQRLDVKRIEVSATRYDPLSGDYEPVSQAGNAPTAGGYYVNPTFIDFDTNNFAYSHKDSATYPWESFADCPHGDQHGSSYDANVHLDHATEEDVSVGLFNGQRLAPHPFSARDSHYRFDFTVDSVAVGAGGLAGVCLTASVTDVQGNVRSGHWGDCASGLVSQLPLQSLLSTL
ncbi:peptidoglycan DD-metalloendopeptidase family protein [Marinobacter sp. SS21]|uniref:peptidoglycan DD-metalloendopeptidase family protein n=1 Tax=Marinobacter sp. SS21 TaxID=2979460 RepID=UPI00232F3B32|nr:peptidoglycan DD-metalloendopeptidase family protein [Marinobacter sp. SS21]MDC0662933.1 peptidoglycan DD-metalloendopeptidase family protein [Marinobacter sp. SS21]